MPSKAKITGQSRVTVLADTEVLTKDGWTVARDLVNGDHIWTVDRKTRIGNFKTPVRKITSMYSGPVLNLRTDLGSLDLPGLSSLMYAGRKYGVVRQADMPPPRSHAVYTSCESDFATDIPENLLSIIFAVIRYGIIDSTGYSVRISDAEHRKTFTKLLGRRGIEKEGWEKWVSVLSSPIMRGFSIDMSKVGSNQRSIVLWMYNYWIQCGTVTEGQGKQLMAYFSRSGRSCDLEYVKNRVRLVSDGSDKCKLLTSPIDTSGSSRHAVEIQVGSRMLMVRQTGCCFLVGA